MKYRNLYILVLIFTASVLFYFVSPKAAEDEDITISTNATWAAGTYTYRDITITNNAILTLQGSYTDDSDGVGVTINARTITIDTGSSISANSQGYIHESGPGKGYLGSSGYGSGAAHGGNGAAAALNNISQENTAIYDTGFRPTKLGSGGALAAGGTGGGAVIINASSAVILNGTISANGGAGGYKAGGGSGGTVSIDTVSISGSGSISALGGNGAGNSGSGGGGGMVSVYYSDSYSLATNSLTVTGGTGYSGRTGDSGTVIIFNDQTKDLKVEKDLILYKDEGVDSSARLTVDGNYYFRNLNVTNNAILYPQSTYTDNDDGSGAKIYLSGDLTVDTGSSINAKGAGYRYNSGPGAGTGSTLVGGGAGHGGAGGRGDTGTGGPSYGITMLPVTLGSGGTTTGGGNGGGAIYIDCSGDIILNGNIDASANDGFPSSGAHGSGGSGGSVFLRAETLTGSANILADGGDAIGYSGGGSGGRIAIFSDLSSYNTANISAAAGAAGGDLNSANGETGTIFIFNTSTGDIEASNDVTFEADQGINPDGSFRDDGIYYFNSLIVSDGATVTIGSRHTNEEDGRGVTINLDGNLTIESGSSIVTDGQGYSGASGPGKGNGGSAQSASGGSYGGLGGPSYNPVLASPTYGSDQENHPYLLGSGGGNGDSGAGGSGGGAITLRVLGNIINNGTVSANGSSGTGGISGWRPGGGSGGSIFIVCDSISGVGSIIASGGAGLGDANFGSGGGGGGRISIVYSTVQSMSTENITAPGGAGGGAVVARNGSSGTVNITQRTLPAADFSLKNPNNNSTQYTNTTDVEIVPADGDVDRYKDAASASELPPTFYAPGWNNVGDGKSLETGEGAKTVRAWLKDQNELIASSVGESTIILDQTEPTISVTGPGSTSSETTIVSGTVSDNLSGINSLTIQVVTLNSPIIFFNPQGQEITVNQDGSFSATVALSVGDNQISLVTTDGAGNSTTENLTVAREGSSSVGETDEDTDQTGTGNIAQENIDTNNDSSQNPASGSSAENEKESLPENEKNLTEKIEDNVKTIGGCLLGNCPSKVRTATIYSFFGGISISILVYLLVARSKRRKKK